MAKYKSTQACALEFIDEFQKHVQSLSSKIELDIIRGEGDFVHQMVDYVVMGAYNKTEIMPADTNGILESLLYSRHTTGDSHELPLPCAESVLSDTKKQMSVLQRTCGTSARISLMTYIIHEIINGDTGGIKEQIVNLIIERVKAIRAEMSDIGNYGCKRTNPYTGQVSVGWDQCCRIPGACTPGESTFEPNVPEVNMILNASHLGSVIAEHFLFSIQYQGLTNIEVCIFFKYYM